MCMIFNVGDTDLMAEINFYVISDMLNDSLIKNVFYKKDFSSNQTTDIGITQLKHVSFFFFLWIVK